MKSQQIEQQIDVLQKRRESVAIEATEAEQRLNQARIEALSGNGAAAEVISPAQGNHNALCGLLDAIDAQLIDLRAQFQVAQGEEKRAADAQQVRELNKQKTANAEASDERLKKLDEYLCAHIPALVTERVRDGELRREITALGGVSDVQSLGERRWSTSGLKYAQHIATMLAEEARAGEKREDEQRRIKDREPAAMKVA